ncbi:hypothetical protein F5Y18DRAFT_392365 [Xylariaceae sp. FL1019]|nr:hypothetical protein F5Y18DRAFT_392365 [Xylariaceae sp. FL1019]
MEPTVGHFALVRRYDGENAVTIAVIGVAVTVTALLAVALRFYARYYVKVRFELDDWFILSALLVTLGTEALVFVAAARQDNDKFVAMVGWIASVDYYFITCATKMSLLCLYHRIFSIDQSFRRQVIIGSVVVVGFWIGSTVANLTSCIPIRYTWINHDLDPRYCFNFNNFWLATGIIEAVFDIILLVMPIRMVKKLQMNKTKKIAVGLVFFVGIFVIISGIVKTILSYAPGERSVAAEGTPIWTTVHTGTGIICACLPTLWWIFPRLAKSTPWAHWSGWRSVERSREGGTGRNADSGGETLASSACETRIEGGLELQYQSRRDARGIQPGTSHENETRRNVSDDDASSYVTRSTTKDWMTDVSVKQRELE